MGERTVIMEITRIEAAHMSTLIAQFVDLLDDSAADDPALGRIAPDGYADDPAAAAEFRALTESDLLDRRRADARVVLARLQGPATLPDRPTDAVLRESVAVTLPPDEVEAWLRTLAALRLVLAERLGVFEMDDDVAEDDPRYGVYEWVGYRLEGLVAALDGRAS